MKRTTLSTRGRALLLVVALAACSGGGAAQTLPSNPGAIAGNGGGSLQITVPYAAGSSAGSKSPQFVSPGTKSVKVVATANAGCGSCTAAGQTVIASLNSASPNCVVGANGLTCTLTFALAPGAYTLGISTYSGIVSGGAPSGTLLSENQSVPLAIVSGANSVANAVLDGVPASFDLVPTQGSLVRPNSVYRALQWAAPMTISIITRDATGAAIVGPGAPITSATFNNPGNNYANVSITGGTITATTPNYGRAASLVISATAASPECAAPGAVCSASLTIGMDQQMAVASRPNDSVVVWQLSVPNVPLATVTQGVSAPTAAKFDANGDLFVMNTGNNTITEYAYPFTGAPIATISTGINAPQAIAFNRFTDELAVSNFGNNTVAVFAPPYTGAPGIIAGLHQPGSVAFDPVAPGDLFVANPGNNTILGFPSPYVGQAATSTITQGLNAPRVLFFMGNVAGDLYVGNGGSIEQFHRPFNAAVPALTIGATAALPLSGPVSIAYSGYTSQVIEADPFAQAVNRYTLNSASGSTVSTGSPNPQCVIVDNDGNLYVCNYAYTQIQAYAPNYTGASTGTYSQGLGGTDSIALFP